MLVEIGRVERAREWLVWALANGELSESMVHLEIAFDAHALVQRRLALWMQYDHGLEPHEENPEFVMLLARGKP